MQNSKSIYLFSVLKNKTIDIGIICGTVLSLLLGSFANEHLSVKLAPWQSSMTAAVIKQTLVKLSKNDYTAVIIGSSQCAQIQTPILTNEFNMKLYVSTPPGSDVAYIAGLINAVISKKKKRPVVLAEFSRYVVSPIEERVYRDMLFYLPVKYWYINEFIYAVQNKKYRKFVWQSLENNLIPLIKYSEAIKGLLFNHYPNVLSWLVSPDFIPKKQIVERYVSPDGHSSSYPLGKYPYRLPKSNKHPPYSKHKIDLWRILLKKHIDKEIFLVLIKPPYHKSIQFYYDSMDPILNKLESEFRTNDIQIIDCTTLQMKKEDCFDAHHFTKKGCAKYTRKIGKELQQILKQKR